MRRQRVVGPDHVDARLGARCGGPVRRPTTTRCPTGHTIAGGVTVDGAGSVWFGVQGVPRSGQPTPSLARLIPAQASPGTSNGIATFPTPDPAGIGCCGNQLRSVTFNPKAGDGKLYYVRSDGTVGSGLPASLVAGPDHRALLHHAARPSGSLGHRPVACRRRVVHRAQREQRRAHLLRRSHRLLQRRRPGRRAEHRDPERQHHAQQPALLRAAGGHRGRAGRPAVVRRGEPGQPGLPRRELQRQRRQLRRVPDLAVREQRLTLLGLLHRHRPHRRHDRARRRGLVHATSSIASSGAWTPRRTRWCSTRSAPSTRRSRPASHARSPPRPTARCG